MECKPFKKHHTEQLKLVSDFSWIDFDRLADVGELITKTLSAEGVKEYMDDGRIKAIAEMVNRRIREPAAAFRDAQAAPVQTDSTEDMENKTSQRITPRR